MQSCTCSAGANLLRRVVVSTQSRLPFQLQQIRTGATRAARIPTATTTGQSGGLFKTYKPLTPSLRHVRQPIHAHLHKGKPLRALTIAKRGNGGRNNTGRITTRFRGGGHKRRIRLVDFRRQIEGEQTVERIEYDPGRTAHIALLKHDGTGELSYILAPDGLRTGDKVQSWPTGVGSSSPSSSASSTSSASATPLDTDPAAPQTLILPSEVEAQTHSRAQEVADDADDGQPASLTTSLLRASMLRTGNQLPLHLMPTGTTVHCISIHPRSKAALCRSAGSYGKIVATSSSGSKGQLYAQVQLQSGEVRKLNRDCTAVIGSVSNREHQNKVLGKAGRNRWLGRKPHVRGVAMNATDHPHGGGRGKSKGNKHPRTPQGILTKGKRTRRPGPTGNRMVVRQRPRGKEKKGNK